MRNVVILHHYAMDQPAYDVKVLEDGCRFDFLSLGYTATHKAILYRETKIPYLYSLTLAKVQWDEKLSATINRIAISKDLDKFLEKYLIWGVRSDDGKREPLMKYEVSSSDNKTARKRFQAVLFLPTNTSSFSRWSTSLSNPPQPACTAFRLF